MKPYNSLLMVFVIYTWILVFIQSLNSLHREDQSCIPYRNDAQQYNQYAN